MPTGAPTHRKPGAIRWLTVGFAAYFGWLVVNFLMLILMPFGLLIEALGGERGLGLLRRVVVRFLGLFFLGYFRLIRLYRVAELPDLESLNAAAPCVFCANHRSWLDALLLAALIRDVRIPVNREYTRVPLAGRMMGWLGCIALDRHSRESLAAAIGEVKELVARGLPVAVFPEGTRAPIGQLKPFSGVFFRVAAEAGVPVVPLLLHLDQPFLGPGSENFLTPRGTVLRIRLLPAVRPEDGERGADLGRRVEKVMRAELERLDRGDPGGTDEKR